METDWTILASKIHKSMTPPKSSGVEDDLLIKPAGTLTIQGAIEVYSQGYLARLTESLGETFESIWTYLGDDNFFELCHQFIQTSPSLSYDLGLYGHHFPQWLSDQKDLIQDDPFLPDLASFNLKIRELFHTPYVPKFNLDLSQDLQKINLKINPHSIFQSDYSIFSIWKSLSQKQSLDFEWWQPQTVLIYKFGDQVRARSLNDVDQVLVKTFQQQVNFAEALQQLEKSHPNLNPQKISSFFAEPCLQNISGFEKITSSV